MFCIDFSITNRVFADILKFADVISIFKKDDPFDKKKLQTCQTTISKIYEKLMRRQINNYITIHLSP